MSQYDFLVSWKCRYGPLFRGLPEAGAYLGEVADDFLKVTPPRIRSTSRANDTQETSYDPEDEMKPAIRSSKEYTYIRI